MDSIIIEDVRKFTKILPLYFDTSNYTSFVRQLSYYDCLKVKNENGHNEFKLEGFSCSANKKELNLFGIILQGGCLDIKLQCCGDGVGYLNGF